MGHRSFTKVQRKFNGERRLPENGATTMSSHTLEEDGGGGEAGGDRKEKKFKLWFLFVWLCLVVFVLFHFVLSCIIPAQADLKLTYSNPPASISQMHHQMMTHHAWLQAIS